MTRDTTLPPRAARPHLSIITVFWNSREDAPEFVRAIEAARRELPFAVEVIAVDNGSGDGTAELLARDFPWVRTIANAHNAGFAPACNQGLAAARGKFLLLLNPDCEANAAALAAMIRFLRDHPRTGAVGCTLLHGDGLPQHSHHHEPSWWSYWATHSLASPLLLRAQKLLLGRQGDGAPRRVDWLMGACLMVPRRVYRRVGGLDPEYFMYSEDADWCRRIRDAGFAVVHLPATSMVHHHGTSARRRPEFAFRRLYRSLLLYTQKHLRGPRGWMLRAAAVIADLSMRMPVYLVAGSPGRRESVRRVLAMYVSGNANLYPDEAPRN